MSQEEAANAPGVKDPPVDTSYAEAIQLARGRGGDR